MSETKVGCTSGWKDVAIGCVGEVFVSGDTLAIEYYNNPDLNAAKFLTNWHKPGSGNRYEALMFRTGDLGRFWPDGTLQITGRCGDVVKLRGYTVDLGSVGAVLATHEDVSQVLVIADGDGIDRKIVAYVVIRRKQKGIPISPADLREFIGRQMPHYCVPSAFVFLNSAEEIPVNSASAKLDRKKLCEHAHNAGGLPELRDSSVQDVVRRAFASTIGVFSEEIQDSDDFFAVGGHSLSATKLAGILRSALCVAVSVSDIFRNPTVKGLAGHLERIFSKRGNDRSDPPKVRGRRRDSPIPLIAVVGMSCRFPGCNSLDEFWDILVNGKDGMRILSDSELREAGVRDSDIRSPNYVKRVGLVDEEHVWGFDADFFNLRDSDAARMDPQHRVLLELSWEALQDASIDPHALTEASEKIGIVAGVYMNTYGVSQPGFSRLVDEIDLDPSSFLGFEISNDKDYAPSRVAYLLNLSGPALNVQSSCSTALSCVSVACDQLSAGKCTVCLAGAVSLVYSFRPRGYMYQEGMVNSQDGFVRPFDKDASGTVLTDGGSCVVLKLLDNALEEGDDIYAVIRGGCGINNDGSSGKSSFSGVSIDGQKDAIVRCYRDVAQVPMDSLSYIEAHGTATLLGDPVEISALCVAEQEVRHSFDANPLGRSPVLIGSVKGNIGHVNIASGLAGLTKIALCLRNELLTKSVNCLSQNPKISFPGDSCLGVLMNGREWKRVSGTVRRAGLSSFGVGGTNVHLCLEEPPAREGPSNSDINTSCVILPISAHSENSLCRYADSLARWMESRFLNRPLSVLQVREQLVRLSMALIRGRRFRLLRASCCISLSGDGRDDDAAQAEMIARQAVRAVRESCSAHRRSPKLPSRKVSLLFPGQGSFREGDLATALRLPCFRSRFEFLFGATTEDEFVSSRIDEPEEVRVVVMQAAVCYTLGMLLSDLLREAVCSSMGHSLGELIAVAVSGLWKPLELLDIVATRTRLMFELGTRGCGMLAVWECEKGVILLLQEFEREYSSDCIISASNSTAQSVVSGSNASLDSLVAFLKSKGIRHKRLGSRLAFHHPLLMARAAEAFVDYMRPICRSKGPDFRRFAFPIISSVSGEILTVDEAVSPDYWGQQILSCVLFEKGSKTLLSSSSAPICVECGTSNVLKGILELGSSEPCDCISTGAAAGANDISVLKVLQWLWVNEGAEVDFEKLFCSKPLAMCGLPGYCFDRTIRRVEMGGAVSRPDNKHKGIPDWFLTPSMQWEPLYASETAHCAASSGDLCVAIVPEELVLLVPVVRSSRKVFVVCVHASSSAVKCSEERNKCCVNFDVINSFDKDPALVVSALPGLKGFLNSSENSLVTFVNALLMLPTVFSTASPDLAFASFAVLARALLAGSPQGFRLESRKRVVFEVLGMGLVSMDDCDCVFPWKSLVLGVAPVLAQEYPSVAAFVFDLGSAGDSDSLKSAIKDEGSRERLRCVLSRERNLQSREPVVGFRRIVQVNHSGPRGPVKRFVPRYQRTPLGVNGASASSTGGKYLITGGLGRIGRKLIVHLTEQRSARQIVVTSRATRSQSEAVRGMEVITIEKFCAQHSVVLDIVFEWNGCNALEWERLFRLFGDDGVVTVDQIFHCAGVANLCSLEKLTDRIVKEEFEPKVHHLGVLSTVLEESWPWLLVKNVLVFSSLASVLGGFGMAAYAAANRFCDVFVHQMEMKRWKSSRSPCTSWCSVNWDDWEFEYKKEQIVGYESLKGVQERRMSVAQGLEALELVLGVREAGDSVPQILVSVSDFELRLSNWVANLCAWDNSGVGAACSLSSPTDRRLMDPVALEEPISSLFGNILERPVGVDDNFFEKGGDSLLLIDLIKELHRSLGVRFGPTAVFENPTPGSLASYVRRCNKIDALRLSR